ncbi:MAG: hypothetical protein J2P25_14400, partial [Nocardiopsaceae bacterium]|nr:hypothetical protein [Nocardiopsaceae bacterium]
MRRRATINHHAAATAARRAPGEWVRAGLYPSGGSITNALWRVRAAFRLSAYEPAGAFEARATAEGDDSLLEVRYVAEERRPRRGGRSVPLHPDAERILGQIRRGEVQAGPEGARRIAAWHEAAYG